MNITRSLISFALAAMPLPALAGTLTFHISGIPSGATLPVDVSATFTNVGNNLQIDLYNNQAGTDPLQVLAGIVFNVSGTAPDGTSLLSAVTGSGSDLYSTPTSGTPDADLAHDPDITNSGWVWAAPLGYSTFHRT